MTQGRPTHAFLLPGFMLGVLLLFMSASPAAARPGTVQTTDGRVFQGDVTETQDGYAVNVGGIRTVVPKEQVEAVFYGTFTEQFRQRIEALKADDIAGRLQLGREGLAAGEYDLAREAALAALRIRADSAEAETLLQAIDRQQRLSALGRPGGQQQDAAGEGDEPDGQARADAPAERRLLEMADVYEIRRKELKPGDNVRVRFVGRVKQDFAAANGEDFAAFNRLDPVAQALRIIEAGTPEMVQQVEITTDPEALADFRRQIQPMIQNCLTSGCHNSGGFVLFDRATQVEVAYTNFYILTQYAKAPEGGQGGIFGGAARGMIQRGQGNTSLLAQYALPPRDAETPHPDVPRYNGVLRGTNDPNFRRLVQWQNESLKPISPSYNIDYKIPGTAPAAPVQGD
ncbi:MAG: hypothetical protein ACFCVE_00860 [Phycisphaerae bacterium]